MQILFFSIVSLFTVIFSYRLFSHASGSMDLNKINMISFIFYIQLVVFCFVGVNLAVFNLSDHYLINRISNEIRIFAYFSVCYVMIVMPLSMIACNSILRVDIKNTLSSYYMLWEKKTQNEFLPIILFLLISLCSIIYIYVMMKEVAWLYYFVGMADDAMAARINATRQFPGIEHIKNILGLGLTPMLCYIAYCYQKVTLKILWRLIFTALFVMTLLALFYNAEKGPILNFFIGFIILEVLIQGKASLRKIVYLGIAIVLIISFMYIFMMDLDVEGLFYLNSGPLGRIFQTQIAGLFYHLDLFPDYYNYLYGASFPPIILNVFDIDHYRSARLVMEYAEPSKVMAGMAGVMNSLFIAEAWANFGWTGWIFSPVIIGVVIQSSYILLLKIVPKHPFYMGFYAFLSVHWPICGGFVEFLWNSIFLILFIIVSAMYLMKKISFRR